MSRYVDADALAYLVVNNGDADFINKVTKLMIDAPSIDIVRCGECKWLCEKSSVYPTFCKKHSGIEQMFSPKPNHFCSYGERKVDAQR